MVEEKLADIDDHRKILEFLDDSTLSSGSSGSTRSSRSDDSTSTYSEDPDNNHEDDDDISYDIDELRPSQKTAKKPRYALPKAGAMKPQHSLQFQEHSVDLPVRPEGFGIIIGAQKVLNTATGASQEKAVFLQYNRGPNQEKGYAEEVDAFRQFDQFVMIDGVSCLGLPLRQVCSMLKAPHRTGLKSIRFRRLALTSSHVLPGNDRETSKNGLHSIAGTLSSTSADPNFPANRFNGQENVPINGQPTLAPPGTDKPSKETTSASSSSSTVVVDPNRLMPAPPLRNSISQTLPRQPMQPSVLSHTSKTQTSIPEPKHSPTCAQGSQSKYSRARVRQRIAADGSVAPVCEPKLTKDGLYQRPVGRTRKGMEWDAVRGIWVPAPNSKNTEASQNEHGNPACRTDGFHKTAAGVQAMRMKSQVPLPAAPTLSTMSGQVNPKNGENTTLLKGEYSFVPSVSTKPGDPSVVIVRLPIRPQGFQLMVQRDKTGRWSFHDYRRGENGEKGEAEKAGAFRRDDEFIEIDGESCYQKSSQEVVAMLKATTSSGVKEFRVRRRR